MTQQSDQELRRNAVVVTGAHRSGTTLLGDILAQASGTWTVWEPFNRHWGLRDVRIAYPYLRRSDSSAPPVASLIRYLDSGRARWSVKKGHGASDRFPAVRAAAKTGSRYMLWRREGAGIAVIKDPFVLLAMGAMQPAVTTRPIVVSVRHPCSWVLSLRRMRWPAGPELNALIAQEQLYEEHLNGMLERKDWTRADDLEAGATAWACLYHMVNVQSDAGARVLVVPLESYARDPVDVLERLYRSASLQTPADLDSIAKRYSGPDKAVTPEAGTKHLLQRDSRALSDAWKAKLSSEEIHRIRAITEPVFGTFYQRWETAEVR